VSDSPSVWSWDKLPFRGAILNTLTVLAGSLLGLWIGKALPTGLQSVAMSGIGLVVVGMAMKMFFQTKNVLIVAASVVLGGIIGKLIGIDVGLAMAADWARRAFGSSDQGFNNGFVTATVLFCVGPMTLMGCIQDGLERKIELLGIKSLLDGVCSVFLAAVSLSFGQGVLASAGVVLLVQGLLTALARPLQPIAKNPNLIAEATAAGGAMMLAISFGLLKIPVVESIPKEVFLPSLVIAPLLAYLFERKATGNGPGLPDNAL